MMSGVVLNTLFNESSTMIYVQGIFFFYYDIELPFFFDRLVTVNNTFLC